MISVMLNVYRNHIQFIRDWGRREGSRVRPVRTKETFSAIDRTINVKEVWTPARAKQLVYSATCSFLSTAVQKKVTKTESERPVLGT